MIKTASSPETFSRYQDFESEVGHIKLVLALDDSISIETTKKRTIIRRLSAKAPFLVQRALYPYPAYSHLAHVCLMSSAGGILQGDRLSISVDAGQHTSTRITTQASTKLHKMDRGYAKQHIQLRANKGSYLEFTPRSTIPFKSSRFYQETDLSIDQDAKLLYAETLSSGRIASGERFEFEAIEMKVAAHDFEGKLLFLDNTIIGPGKKVGYANHQAPFICLFGNKNILSTIYLLVPSDSAQSLGQGIDKILAMHQAPTSNDVSVNQLPSDDARLVAGWTSLPNKSGLIMRMLSDSIDEVEDVIGSVAMLCRRLFLCK